jgi:transcriptional antiterminator RfaH
VSRLFDEPKAEQSAWYTIQTKPRKELQVYRYLLASGLLSEVYYPSLTVKPVNPRASTIRAFFPGYLFVNVDLKILGEGHLEWAPGAVGLVRFGGEPAVVPENFINELKTRIVQLNRSGGMLSGELKSGDPVRVSAGPFEGYEAIFDHYLNGEERVQILLQWLGRRIKVTTPAKNLKRS